MIALLVLIQIHCAKNILSIQTSPCTSESHSFEYEHADEVQDILESITNAGVPGAAMAIKTPKGTWSYESGLASIENKIPLAGCHLHYLQSIAKTYMAVATLQLVEDGAINLYQTIDQYLPEKAKSFIPAEEEITIKMLLNHTSGLTDYNFQPAYITYLIQHPEHSFTPYDYLGFVKNKPLDFQPGEKFSYRNINYLLLALIVDNVTGDHATFIQDNIFDRIGLNNTFYRNDSNYLEYDNLVNSYWDRHGSGVIENISKMQRINVSSLIGDDGIVCTTKDAVQFLEALIRGQLLENNTFEMMKEWQLNSKGEATYGLGLDLGKFGSEEQIGYGHSGGGIGAGCELYYFPKQDITIFLVINLGTITASPIHENVIPLRESLYDAALK